MRDRMGYFGQKWDAPMTDDAEPIPTPVGEACILCVETIADDDQGIQYVNGPYAHKECHLRSAVGGIGHLVDHPHYCRGLGPDAGLPYRVSSLLTWRWFVDGERFTVDDLDELRATVP